MNKKNILYLLLITVFAGCGSPSSFKPNVDVKDKNNTTDSKDINLSQIDCNQTHKTGQITSYYANDDGDLQKGFKRSYARNYANQTVIDNVTSLMWQDNEIMQKPWVTQINFDSGDYNDTSGDTAMSYCENLEIDSYTDWRLPTIDELYYLRDLGREDSAIDPIFFNTYNGYWSSTTVAGSSKSAWTVRFYYGNSSHYDKNISDSVRCVRNKEQP